ncbi:MAG: TrmH family RNA methyltransferase [Gemmatimonadota bacterium]|nr:TrmH family RNA methyltransferase [Gemmatimonadota bacterium]
MSGSRAERFRRARGDPALAVLEGFHALKHALRFGAEIEEAATRDPDSLERLATSLAPDVAGAISGLAEPVEEDVFERLVPRPPATGVVAIARRPPVDPDGVAASGSEEPLVLLDRPRRLGNVGAAVRVAAAAGAAGVLATGRHDPWHPAALRGSAGLHFALPVARVDALPEGDRPRVAIDPEGEPISPGVVPAGAALLFGTERCGLDEATAERAERRLAIPMRPGVSSLNLATAVAVVLYAWRFAR